MNDNTYVALGQRKPKKSSIRGALIGVGTGIIFLTIDLIFYFRNRARGSNVVLEIIFMVISCIYLAIALLILLLARSFAKTNKKLEGKPLVGYDEINDEFIVYSLIDGQEKHIKNIDLLDISSSEDGEVRVSVRKVPKNDDYAIGFAEISEVVLIKQKIEEIRAKGQ